MPLNIPRFTSIDYIRVTKLAGTVFVVVQYDGTTEEETRDGQKYTSHVFQIYLPNEDRNLEFRATQKFTKQFSDWLTTNREQAMGLMQLGCKYTIHGFSRNIQYVFEEVSLLPDDLSKYAELKNSGSKGKGSKKS